MIATAKFLAANRVQLLSHGCDDYWHIADIQSAPSHDRYRGKAQTIDPLQAGYAK